MSRNGGRGLGERLLVAAEIVATWALVHWWLRTRSVTDAVAAARAPLDRPTTHSAVSGDAPQRLGHAVERTLGALRIGNSCLARSLILTRLLARRGLETTVVLGVRARPGF